MRERETTGLLVSRFNYSLEGVDTYSTNRYVTIITKRDDIICSAKVPIAQA